MSPQERTALAESLRGPVSMATQDSGAGIWREFIAERIGMPAAKMSATQLEIRTELLASVDDYVVINDGGSAYLMRREDLGGATEKSLKAMGGEQYQAWCDAHSADQRYGMVGGADNIAICNAMADAECEYWCIG